MTSELSSSLRTMCLARVHLGLRAQQFLLLTMTCPAVQPAHCSVQRSRRVLPPGGARRWVWVAGPFGLKCIVWRVGSRLALPSLTTRTSTGRAGGRRLSSRSCHPRTPCLGSRLPRRAGFLIYRDARPRVARAMHTLHSRTRAGGGGAVATVCEMRAQCSCNALHMQGVGGGEVGGMGGGGRGVAGHSNDLAVTEPGHRHHTYTTRSSRGLRDRRHYSRWRRRLCRRGQ